MTVKNCKINVELFFLKLNLRKQKTSKVYICIKCAYVMCANLSMVAKGLVLISYSVKYLRQKPIEFTMLGL